MSGATTPVMLVLLGGFGIAFVFGVVANRSNFCIMGSVSDVVNMHHWGRMRMWMLAVAVAVLGTGVLHSSGQIDIAQSVYQRPLVPWLSLLLGGAVFGVGMTLSGGCPNKNLVRLGAGSVRSLVVLVFLAIASYMTLKGLLAQWRVSFLDPMVIDLTLLGQPSLPAVLGKLTGLAAPAAAGVGAALVSLALLVFVFRNREFRADTGSIWAGILLGLLVVAAWYLTGHLGFGENPQTLENVYFATNSRTLESLSFVAPLAYSLEMLMLWTDKSLRLTFGIMSVLGVACGSLAAALVWRQFRWEGFASLQDLRNNLVGAVLMGFGGVTAMGCTIGQGLSGLSTLAIGSCITVAGIVGGCALTIKWLQR